MADEYEFEQDFGYDDGGYGDPSMDEEEEEWEQAVRMSYEEGKRIQQNDKAGAIAAFKKSISLDQQHARWTFKSHKSLYRVCLMHRAEDEMLEHYKDSLEAEYGERTRADVDKMIDKISSRSTHLSAPCRKRIAQLSRDYIENKYKAGDASSADKMWFNLTLRLAQFAVDDNDMATLQKLVDAMYAWCGPEETAITRRGTQLMSVYSYHIHLCTAREQPRELRKLYQKATAIDSAVCPPRVLAVIHDSGGRMFLRQRQYEAAANALASAFRNYDLAGDPKKLSALQFLVVASMLAESVMNPFDMPEAKSYKSEPEITVMMELFEVAGTSKSLAAVAGGGNAAAHNSNAGKGRDVKRFMAILNDPKRSKHLTQDPFLYSLIEPLITRVRGVALVELVRPYTAIKLSSLAHSLATTPADAERLAGRLIVEGRLQGRIDQVHGHLYLAGGGSAGGNDDSDDDDDDTGAGTRSLLLRQLLDSAATLRSNVISNLRRGN